MTGRRPRPSPLRLAPGAAVLAALPLLLLWPGTETERGLGLGAEAERGEWQGAALGSHAGGAAWPTVAGEAGAELLPAGKAGAELLPTGSIVGEVVRPDERRRRVADRYPGQRRGGARTPPPVPVSVHLEGRLPGAPPGEPDLVQVAQRDTTFIPPLVVVPVGTQVAFPNEDPFFHNVFSYSRAKRFDLGRYPQGESKSVVFDQPGYVKVFCEVHQWMRGAVLVVENAFHQVVDEDGTFRLDGVPAGAHTLVVTDFERGTEEVEVEVPDGGTAEVRVELDR